MASLTSSQKIELTRLSLSAQLVVSPAQNLKFLLQVWLRIRRMESVQKTPVTVRIGPIADRTDGQTFFTVRTLDQPMKAHLSTRHRIDVTKNRRQSLIVRPDGDDLRLLNAADGRICDLDGHNRRKNQFRK